MKFNNLKSQVFYSDFIISILIFTVALVLYFVYTTNLSTQDTELDDLLTDAKTISSSLTSAGYPNNWKANNVARIGFTDDGNIINNEKFNEFMEINYNQSKKLLGTTYDYILFFVNESNDVQNIEGFCGTGGEEVKIIYDISAAYYYETPGEEEFLKSFMVDTFQADVYCEKSQDCPGWSFDDLINKINTYDFIVIEHPIWSGAQIGDFEEVADDWLLGGGILFIGGELPAPDQYEAFGVKFNKKFGQSDSQRIATVVNEDEYIAFDLGDNIRFVQYYFIEKVPGGANTIDIARFNGTYIEFDEIRLYGDIALARWTYGNGKILFFSDFDAEYLAGDFQEILEGSAKKWANAQCSPINISNIKRENLVKTNRLLVYDSDIVKMVLYLWE